LINLDTKIDKNDRGRGMSSGSVWLIDGDKGRRDALRTILEFMDWSPIFLEMGSDLGQVLAHDGKPAFVLLGCSDPASAGTDVKALTALLSHVPVVVVGEEDIQQILIPHVSACLRYPFHKEELTSVLEDILAGVAEHATVKFPAMVGRSPAIQGIRQLMSQVADSDVNVLILGESGTGKEVVARSLHQHSGRADKPFVPVNCGAIPAELLESELFGHEKGAFTGAIGSRKGRFELAEGGTLFLDEIGDMSLNMQVKLLRVLQERTFERVGGTKSINADVRIIAATHRNLEQLIEQGQFREDLFYRLNVFPIDMPPLRERDGDVPLLIEELLQRIEREQRGTVQLTPAALNILSRYSWPGNVRELSNVIERLVIMYPDQEVDVADLPDKILSRVDNLQSLAVPAAMDVTEHYRLPGEGIDLKQHLSDVECSLIKQALDESGGVVAHAAKRLRLRRTTLVEKLRKYGLNARRDEASVA